MRAQPSHLVVVVDDSPHQSGGECSFGWVWTCLKGENVNVISTFRKFLALAQSLPDSTAWPAKERPVARTAPPQLSLKAFLSAFPKRSVLKRVVEKVRRFA